MDIFVAKLVKYDTELKELVEEYLENSIFTMGVCNHTTLTYLTLKTNLEFTDTQYKFMLGLNDTATHQLMYHGILVHIKIVANELFKYFKVSNLLELPLTNIKDIVYQIGLNFKDMFFVPITTTVYQSWSSPLPVVRYISRFNEMWIITSLLNREYGRIGNRGQ